MANLDMAGIITRVCTSLKSKFSKVTFEQAVTSGTKLGTVNIDGTGHDIYAPTVPSASMVVTISGSSSTGRQMNKTAGEIRDAILDGVFPIFVTSDVQIAYWWTLKSATFYPGGAGNIVTNMVNAPFNFSSLDSYPYAAASGGGNN